MDKGETRKVLRGEGGPWEHWWRRKEKWEERQGLTLLCSVMECQGELLTGSGSLSALNPFRLYLTLILACLPTVCVFVMYVTACLQNFISITNSFINWILTLMPKHNSHTYTYTHAHTVVHHYCLWVWEPVCLCLAERDTLHMFMFAAAQKGLWKNIKFLWEAYCKQFQEEWRSNYISSCNVRMLRWVVKFNPYVFCLQIYLCVSLQCVLHIWVYMHVHLKFVCVGVCSAACICLQYTG